MLFESNCAIDAVDTSRFRNIFVRLTWEDPRKGASSEYILSSKTRLIGRCLYNTTDRLYVFDRVKSLALTCTPRSLYSNCNAVYGGIEMVYLQEFNLPESKTNTLLQFTN